MDAGAEQIKLQELCGGKDPSKMSPTPDLRSLAEVNARLIKKNLPLSVQLSFD